MLSNKYKIPTYNYATLPLQFLWEDTRFVTNKPQYVIIVGNESEIMQNGWIEVLKDTPIRRTIIPYESYNQWEQINNKPAITYSYASRETKRYSIIRYLLKVLKVKILNAFLPRYIIFAMSNAENVEYDKTRDILFYDKIVFNPKLSSENLKKIEQTIKTLTTTREVLATRNIKLLVVPVPSKVHMHSDEFMNLPESMFALTVLEKEMTKNKIEFVDIYHPMKEFLKKNPNELLYFPDDGHWNTKTNQIIVQQIAEKLQN